MIGSGLVTVCSNLIVFGIIPFVWWLIFWRKKENFFHWLGFYKPKIVVKWWLLLIFLVVYVFFNQFDFTVFMDEASLAAIEQNTEAVNLTESITFSYIIGQLLVNFIGNGVAEEMFYRGFLTKRLCAKFGSVPGSLIQAALFGLMHNVLWILAGYNVNLSYHLLMFFFTGMASLLLALANEKIFNKSIWPSVILHGTGNFFNAMMMVL